MSKARTLPAAAPDWHGARGRRRDVSLCSSAGFAATAPVIILALSTSLLMGLVRSYPGDTHVLGELLKTFHNPAAARVVAPTSPLLLLVLPEQLPK
eukprot:750251-Amphidinium_carterae.1